MRGGAEPVVGQRPGTPRSQDARALEEAAPAPSHRPHPTRKFVWVICCFCERQVRARRSQDLPRALAWHLKHAHPEEHVELGRALQLRLERVE